MSTRAPDPSVSNPALSMGRLLGALAILLPSCSAGRLSAWPAIVDAIDRICAGSSEILGRALGLVGAAGITVTSIPPTSIVGAILWSGEFGTVVATHVCVI